MELKMANQWTSADQERFDNSEAMAEISDQKQPTTQRIEIDCKNEQAPIFTFRDIIVSFICGYTTANNGWVCMEKAHINIQEAGMDFTSNISFKAFCSILEDLEEEEIISCHWDIKTFTSNV